MTLFDDLLKKVNREEVEEARAKTLLDVHDFVIGKYPKISLATLEKNLIEFSEIKKADDACKMCVSWEQCPNMDLMKLCGELTSLGYVKLYHVYCPCNHRKPKRQECETATDYKAKRKY